MNYTDAMIQELKDGGVWDLDKAKAFADRYKLSARSVVAKIGALGLTYKAREGKETKAVKKVSKADLTSQIEAKLGATLPSLAKMNMDDLNIMLEKL